MKCAKCLGPLSTQDQASYGQRCENCYVGRTSGTTGSAPAAIRQASDSRINQFGSNKRQKARHIGSGG